MVGTSTRNGVAVIHISRGFGAERLPPVAAPVTGLVTTRTDFDWTTVGFEDGVPELWIADVSTESLLVHRKPSDRTYADQRQLRSGDEIAPLAFEDLTLRVADIFGS